MSSEIRFLTEKNKNFVKKSDAPKRKFATLKAKFLELANEVNCECFPKMFHESSTFAMKLIWTFLFVFFAGMTCVILRENVLDYLRQDCCFILF